MAYGISVSDQYGSLTSGPTVVMRFVEAIVIPKDGTSTYTVDLTVAPYDGSAFMYFEPLFDGTYEDTKYAPTFTVSSDGNTATIVAMGVGGTCYVGVY